MVGRAVGEVFQMEDGKLAASSVASQAESPD